MSTSIKGKISNRPIQANSKLHENPRYNEQRKSLNIYFKEVRVIKSSSDFNFANNLDTKTSNQQQDPRSHAIMIKAIKKVQKSQVKAEKNPSPIQINHKKALFSMCEEDYKELGGYLKAMNKKNNYL